MAEGNCIKHLFERAENICGHCGHSYCVDCLVQPLPRKPPICKDCAMVAAGIRTQSRVAPAMSRKEIKARYKADERERKALIRSQKASRAPAAPPATNGAQMIVQPDVVPPQLARTTGAARTKRLWRAAG